MQQPFHEIVDEAIEAVGAERLADSVGVSTRTIYSWKVPGARPNKKNMEALAKGIGMSVTSLYASLGDLSGQAEYPEAEACMVPAEAQSTTSQGYDPTKHYLTTIKGPMGYWESTVATTHKVVGVVTSLDGGLESGRIVEYGAIPRAMSRLSAGRGLEPAIGSMGLYAFRKDWLDQVCPSRRCVLMEVSGDSMEPELKNGDLALVDGAQRDITPGRLYAVAINDLVVVKRLDIKPGKVILRSANPSYESYEIEPDLPGVQVLGRVIWTGRMH